MKPVLQVVVMGVSGTGKSVIGRTVAEQLGYEFLEGDAFHSEANIAKMSAGTPLDDDDRRPWLEKLAELLADRRSAGTASVLACSSLKRRYRDILRGGAAPTDIFFLHLDPPAHVLRARIEQREHFMPASLLQSQLDALEPLEPDETGRELRDDVPIPDMVEMALRVVGEHERSTTGD